MPSPSRRRRPSRAVIERRKTVAAVLAVIGVAGAVALVALVILRLASTAHAGEPTPRLGTIPSCADVRQPQAVSESTEHGRWSAEQRANAAVVASVAHRRGVDYEAAYIAMMTAMQESSLRNLDHDDDAVNPDGTIADGGGLFQQQPSQGWGTWAEVTDPVYATHTFLDALLRRSDWASIEPWQAAHLVQVNRAADDYRQWRVDSVQLVNAFIDASSCAGGTVTPSD